MILILIKELFESAIEESDTSLQALIMFLVFEKKVLVMEQDVKSLDLYFLSKHERRMGEELGAYKNKMSMEDRPSAYRVFTQEQETIYVKAENDWQSARFIHSLGFTQIGIEHVSDSQLMYYEGKNQAMAEIIRNLPTPSYIGSNDAEQKPYEKGRYTHE